MGFILLLAISAFAVAGSAAFFSVYGLAQIFSASFIAVIIMGSSLEIGKLVAASYLYRFWKVTPYLIKAYLFVAILTLMVITSLGIFGFLTAAYQTDSIGLKQQQEQIVLYEKQKESYQERLDGINAEIAKPDANYISKRMELIDKFEAEKTNIVQNLEDIDNKLLELKTGILQTEAKIGPIIYVAEVLGESPDKATFWFVLIIIGVFDPLAVSLTLATNIALRQRKLDKEREKIDKKIYETVEHVMEHTEHAIEDAVDNVMSMKNNNKIEDPIAMSEVPTTPEDGGPEETPELTQHMDLTETFKDEITQIKKLIRDMDKTDDIGKLSDVIDRLNSELSEKRVRNQLGSMRKK